MFELTSQIRRAALSIPDNIVEGCTRRRNNELRQFMNRARGSLAETEYLYYFSKRLNYHKKNFSHIEVLIEEVRRLLWSFSRKR